MKKYLILAILGLMIAGLSINAQAQPKKGKNNQTGTRTNFVDANGDGICDYFGTMQSNSSKGKFGNGTGVCDSTGKGRSNRGAMGSRFIDANGDGVCDNNVNGTGNGTGTRPMDGTGMKRRSGRGK